MADKKKDKLFVKRYKTLKEHRAAVAARKTLKGGKNVGPVADAAAYGETMKKKKPAAPKKPAATKKPAAKKAKPTKAQTDRFYSSSSTGSIANKEKAKSNFFRSSSGTKGKSLPNYPELKSQPKKRRVNRRGRTVRRKDDYRLF